MTSSWAGIAVRKGKILIWSVCVCVGGGGGGGAISNQIIDDKRLVGPAIN